MTIDEQIAFEKNILPIAAGGMHQAILASLERLKAIDDAQVPEEPMWISELRSDKFPASTDASLLQHIDTLLDLLKNEIADRVFAESMLKDYRGAFTVQQERAEAAEAKLAAIEKMGREPSEGMLSVPPHFKYVRAFTAMFAKMMEELK
jgi:hypothetical protein